MTQWPTYHPDDPDRSSANDSLVPTSSQQPNWLETYRDLGQSAEHPMELFAGGDSYRRSGAWTVPPFLRLNGGFGNLIVDFQMASPASPFIHVEIVGSFGEIIMISPIGWGVDLSLVRPGWASRKSNVADRPEPGFPLLRLVGSLKTGNLKVRYPSKRDLKLLNKAISRQASISNQLQRQSPMNELR
ncbi:MAG: hypothetical protein LBV30_01580 [Propionibacteriaceae bacterium]|nr:hypothetical protein [Propionibacteriaceae bacterium]